MVTVKFHYGRAFGRQTEYFDSVEDAEKAFKSREGFRLEKTGEGTYWYHDKNKSTMVPLTIK
jgi:hypothetical protein